MLELRLAEEGHELHVLGEADGVKLIRTPRTFGTDEPLSELAIVKEADAGVFVGNGKLTSCCTQHRGWRHHAAPLAGQAGPEHSHRRSSGGCADGACCPR